MIDIVIENELKVCKGPDGKEVKGITILLTNELVKFIDNWMINDPFSTTQKKRKVTDKRLITAIGELLQEGIEARTGGSDPNPLSPEHERVRRFFAMVEKSLENE